MFSPSLTYYASVSSNVTQKTTSSRSSGHTNTGTTGEKHKSELQATTPTQDDEQGPPLPKKKKTKGSIGPSQSSAATTPMERNKHNDTADTKTPGWFQLRTKALKNIINSMTNEDRNKLENVADQLQKDGFPEELQRQ